MEIFTKWSSSFSSSYLFVLYFYINLLIAFDCALIGMISPIEVVEEWACHNTEIRLTCSDIESKIAILEASFTPNCTENDDTCEHLNTDKVTLMFARHKLDPQLVQQTEAGRRFLETLRQTHANQQESSEYEEHTTKNSQKKAVIQSDVETIITPKEKRNSMRASLERMIVRYLRKITSDEDDDVEDASERRNRRNLNNSTFFESSAVVDDDMTTSEKEISKSHVSELKNNDNRGDDDDEENDEENGSSDENIDGNKIKNSMWNGNLMCSEKKRRITQLDRFELEKSIENEMDNEINIRNVLNYRCSGKNLCSFVFAADHPFSSVWNSGLVHIKYICMDSYRINKYCGEHLTIGNEISLKDNDQHTERFVGVHSRRRNIEPVEREEPRAEALTQQHSDRNLQYFHQLHNLKILKPSDSETDDITEEELNKLRKENEKNRKQSKNQRIKQGVYSQDFRIMKVLPSDIDQFNDIEQIGNEFYFKKDEPDSITVAPPSTKSDTENEITSFNENNINEHENHIVPEILVKTEHDVFSTMQSQIEKSNEIDSNELFDENEQDENDDEDEEDNNTDNDDFERWNATTDYKIVIREGEEVITNFPELKTKVSKPMSSQQLTELGLLQIHMNTTFDWDHEVIVRHPNQTETDDEDEDDEIVEKVEEEKFIKRIKDSFEKSTNAPETRNETILHTKSGSNDDEDVEFDNSLEGSDVRKNEKISKTLDDVESDDSYEDNSYEKADEDDVSYEAEDGYRKLRNRKYKSVQRTSLGKPLLQGFSMTPGYPKFYIGNTECNWKIIAPKDQKIKVTILDLDLRYDENCMDNVEIVDLKINRVLFSSCSEIEKPQQIISDSNNIEIKVKTKTNIAYPKRGVLIHYAALGCILPELPAHVRLVNRTETIASYKCVKNFVFPDTTLNQRELYCTVRHTWNNILPDCIDQSQIVGSGLVTRFEHNRKDPPVTMSEKEADTIYDIVIPSLLVLGLLTVNGIIFAVIMHYRNKRSRRLDLESKELAEL